MAETLDATVVSVTRNDCAGIERTIDSVRSQRDVHLQHIVVDGKSTDGTVEYLQSLDWPEGSQFMSESDAGIYDAMNKGAALATTPLLVFMNGGDVFATDTTARTVIDSYRAHHWRWAYGITVLTQPDGTVSRIHQMAPFSRVRLGLGLAAVPHQAMWITTELFRKIGGHRLEAGVSADMDLCWSAAERAEPHLFGEVLSIAEEGGVSAQQAPGHYAKAMRKNIKHHHATVTGVRWLDPLAATGVIALTSAVQIVPTWWARRSGN